MQCSAVLYSAVQSCTAAAAIRGRDAGGDSQYTWVPLKTSLSESHQVATRTAPTPPAPLLSGCGAFHATFSCGACAVPACW